MCDKAKILILVLSCFGYVTSVFGGYTILNKTFDDGNRRFLLSAGNFLLSLNEAKLACQSFGLELGRVYSQKDYTYLADMFKIKIPRTYQFWIDLQYNDTLGEAFWNNDSPGRSLFLPGVDTPPNQADIDFSPCPYIDCTIQTCNFIKGSFVSFYYSSDLSVKMNLMCMYSNTPMKYALCENVHNRTLNFTVYIQPQIILNTGLNPSMVASPSCSLDQSSARNLCLQNNQYLAEIYDLAEYESILNFFRPLNQNFGMYEFWINMDYDYEYKFYRWYYSGKQATTWPANSMFYDSDCQGTNDVRGVVLQLQYPQNRTRFMCMPHDRTECYALCVSKSINFTSDSYQYVNYGNWSNWTAWTNCYMYVNGSMHQVTCDYAVTVDEYSKLVEEKKQLELNSIDEVRKQELDKLDRQYKAQDTVGYAFGAVVSLASIFLLVLFTIFIDLTKLAIYATIGRNVIIKYRRRIRRRKRLMDALKKAKKNKNIKKIQQLEKILNARPASKSKSKMVLKMTVVEKKPPIAPPSHKSKLPVPILVKENKMTPVCS